MSGRTPSRSLCLALALPVSHGQSAITGRARLVSGFQRGFSEASATQSKGRNRIELSRHGRLEGVGDTGQA